MYILNTMPPTVQTLETNKFSRSTFAIDLEGEDEFDAGRFDEQARAVDATNRRGPRNDLKFVVIGSEMIFFSYDRMHVDVYMDAAADYSGELVCAGMVSFGNNKPSIWGNSASLEQYRDFPVAASDSFKHTELQATLGKYFDVR